MALYPPLVTLGRFKTLATLYLLLKRVLWNRLADFAKIHGNGSQILGATLEWSFSFFLGMTVSLSSSGSWP